MGWVQERPLAQATGKTSHRGFLVVRGREAWRGYPKGPSRGFPKVINASPQVRNTKYLMAQGYLATNRLPGGGRSHYT